VGTIIYSQPFCQASRTIRDIRQTAKHTFPELYMIGNFYITLMKIFIILVGVIVCYFLVVQHPRQYTDSLNLIAPLVVIAGICRSRCWEAYRSPIISWIPLD
jgi:hypothetical protein